MKLLTKEVTKRLPALRATARTPDPVVQVKFFTPDSGWTWYTMEMGPDEDDPQDVLFYGLVVCQQSPQGEMGYFRLSDLLAIRGPYGLGVERDRYFAPCPLSRARGQ